jgi:hypothetical protein
MIDNRLTLFYEFVNGYEDAEGGGEKKLNYFGAVESVCRAAWELGLHIERLASQNDEQYKEQPVTLQLVEPSMFYNPRRVLKKLLFDKSHHIIKSSERVKSANKLEMELNNQPIMPELSTQRQYLLEVI